MANPPITIGPFTNVPAPGSPIRSDWPASISQFVTDEVRTPKPIAINFDIGQQSGAGFYDVGIVNQAATLAYPVQVAVHAVFQWGSGTGICTATHDIYRFADAGAFPNPPLAHQCAAAVWASTPVVWTWQAAAGASVGFKLRSQLVSGGGGACNFRCHGLYTLKHI